MVKDRRKKFIKGIKKRLPSTDPKKFITKDAGHYALVKKGRTGFFKEEMMREQKWLS